MPSRTFPLLAAALALACGTSDELALSEATDATEDLTSPLGAVDTERPDPLVVEPDDTDDTDVDTDDTDTDPPPPAFTDVQAILTSTCATAGCHNGTQAPDMRDSAWDDLVNVISVQAPTLDYVEPGDPDASYLVRKIEGTHVAAGGSGLQMPMVGCCLAQTDIDTIRAWIGAGAAN